MLRINTLIFFILTACSAHGFSLEGDVGVGYRQDRLNWSFDGGSRGPNILSELIWENLKMVNYYGQVRTTVPYLGYMRATGNYGSIYNGENFDWDYREDNRQSPFAYAENKADRGEAFEVSFAIGRALPGLIPYVTIIPLIGYSWQEQHLQFYDGIQVYYLGNNYDNTPLPDLASNYRAKWYTPFIGVDLFVMPSSRWKIIATAEWHWGQYRGTGYWNLRTDLLSDIRHSASNITGGVFRVQGLYCLYKNATIGIAGECVTMHTWNGLNQVDISEALFDTFGQYIGSRIVTAEGGLNAVHWQSWRLIATAGFDF
jgi:hypothetical protein